MSFAKRDRNKKKGKETQKEEEKINKGEKRNSK